MDLRTEQGRREQGLRIKRAIEKAGLSVGELALRIGCSRALLYQYISGQTLAQPDRLQQIAAETGMPVAGFYGGDPAEDSRQSRPIADRQDPQVRLANRIHQLEELALAQETGPDWSALASTCERILSLVAQAGDASAEADSLLRLGKARIKMGDHRRAADSLERAVSLFAALKDARGEAIARQALGDALLSLGRTSGAVDQYERVARSDNRPARWSVKFSLSLASAQSGQYAQATRYCDEAASLLDEDSDAASTAPGRIRILTHRARLSMACGDFRRARPLAERSVRDSEALGCGELHLEARWNLGVCGLWEGRWADAHRMLTGALTLARFLGDRGWEAVSRATFAILLAALCDCDNCIALAKDALALALSKGDRRAELLAQMALTDAYTSNGRDHEAGYHADQALGVAATQHLVLDEIECRLRIARLGLRTGDTHAVPEQLERALFGAQQIGARHLETVAHILQGNLWMQTGTLREAGNAARQAAQQAHEIGMAPALWEADILLARIASRTVPMHREEAGTATARAVAGIEAVRADLKQAGIADTLMEDRDRLDIYLQHARLLAAAGRSADAADFVEHAAWPPLSERYRHPVSL